ncbi:DUF262 domain-containing protein [Helicobacter labacensis]|uniref:DUF262 domain-containing protein n=1 Tax=Helicobacter labacensis TaxID=2316079 RepID=UPI000EAC03B1|nr:DUF262 domain-containing protein [Helicobacter labacensis]
MQFLKPHYAEYEFKDIIERLDQGEYAIPRFQRDFVWTSKQAAKLIDSMLKGFPTGAFILWKTKEHLAKNREIQGVCLHEIKNNDYVYYVLDGQQRMRALMLAYKGLTNQRGPRTKDNYRDICVLAHPNAEGDYCVVAKKKLEGAVPVCDLITLDPYELEEKHGLEREIVKQFIALKLQIEKYRFPTIEITDAPIENIVEIFTRINTGGTKLSVSEILYARFYMPPNQGDFDLEACFNTLSSDLDKLDFKLGNASLVVQLLSYTLKRNEPGDLNSKIANNTIMRLDPCAVRDQWEKIALCFKSAVEFCKHSLKIPSIDFLPAETTLLPLAYFFYCNQNKPASAHQKEQLQKFFLRCCFFGTNGYSLLKQLGLAEEIYKKNEDIKFDEKLPFFNVSEEFLMGEPLNIKSGLQKTIFLVLAILEPKDFYNNSPVVLDHLFLKNHTRRNLHHFFPKNYLKKLGWADKAADVIANITLISAETNQKIKDKSPQD